MLQQLQLNSLKKKIRIIFIELRLAINQSPVVTIPSEGNRWLLFLISTGTKQKSRLKNRLCPPSTSGQQQPESN